MSYRFLVISDLHAHSHKSFSTIVDGINNRLLVTLNCLKEVRTLCTQRGIKDVIFSGDVFDAKNRTPIVTLNQIFRELKEWDDQGIKTLLIPGNHDLALRNGSEHALEVFSNFRHFTLYQEPYVGPYTLSCGNEIQVAAVPYREDLKPEWFQISGNADAPRIGVAHGLVQGACYIPDGPGLEYDGENLLDHEGIPLELILQEWVDDLDALVVGHIHYSQVLGKKKHILIPGQPWQQHPHEFKQRRSVWEFQIEKKGSEWVPSYARIELQTPPKFVKVSVQASGELDFHPRNLENEIEGNIVQITPESIHVPEMITRNIVERLNDQGAFYVELLPPNILAHEKPEERIDLDLQESPQEIMRKVIESGLIDLKGHEQEDLVHRGHELLLMAQKEESI